jgi:hypothetical protein
MIRAFLPVIAIFAMIYVPPLRHVYDSGVDSLGRAFGRSVNTTVDNLSTTTTTLGSP